MWHLVVHQLENARKMAELDRGRPRQASLRRAVSTAYYAVFQALCETCASELVGRRKSWQTFTPIFRALDHNRLAQGLKHRSLVAIPALERLADAFDRLQAAREWADYNPEPRPDFDEIRNPKPFARHEARLLIELAEDAVKTIDLLDGETRLNLAARLLAKTRK